MNKFINGFEKVAAKGFLSQLGKAGKSLYQGLKESGKSTVGDTLKLKGLSNIGDAAKKSGGVSKMLSTEKGRNATAHAIGKAAPSIVVGGMYAAGAKKLYDKATAPSESDHYYA